MVFLMAKSHRKRSIAVHLQLLQRHREGSSLPLLLAEISSQQIDGVQLVKLSNPILAYRNIRILRMVFQKRNIDVVINQWGMNFMTTLLLRMARGARNVKLVSVLHVDPNNSIVVSKIHNKINRVAKTEHTHPLRAVQSTHF